MKELTFNVVNKTVKHTVKCKSKWLSNMTGGVVETLLYLSGASLA